MLDFANVTPGRPNLETSPLMTDAPAPSLWSTLTLTWPAPPRELEELALIEHQFESLGAAILEDSLACGVEYRDAKTFEVAERPTLVVYTDPETLPALVPRVQTLSQQLGLPALIQRQDTSDDESWRDGWKAFFRPLRPGGGALLVRPSWIERCEDDPVLEIVLDPGRAFGTGQHASTSLCLELLTSMAQGDAPPPSCVLDLGCGSGILGLAAARLFPGSEILAIDIDGEAVDTTVENAAHNQLTARVTARTGTANDLENTHDLVLANIRPAVLIPDAKRIAAATRGSLILSGILVEELAEVLRAYAGTGLHPVGDPATADGWSAVRLERTP